MRPDQHKKKKSAQYQKKHGSKSSENTQNQTSGKTTKNKSSSDGVKTQLKSSVQPVAGPGDPVVAGALNGNTTDDNLGQKSASSDPKLNKSDRGLDSYGDDKSFRRRGLASNWERYEGLDLTGTSEESEDGLRGADFQTLIGISSDSLAQFRFKDEKDWEIEDSTEAPSAGHSEFLSVDFADLAASLECVPLHQRLGIEKEAFGEKLVELMEAEAKQKLSFYKPPSRSTRNIVEENTIADLDIEDLDDESAVSDGAIAHGELSKSLISAQHRHNISKTCDKVKEETSDTLDDILSLGSANKNDATVTDLQQSEGHKLSYNAHVDANSPNKKSVKADSISVIEQKDKDRTVESPANMGSGKEEVSSSVEVNNCVPEEDELDFLLSLETPVQDTSENQDSQSAVCSKETPGQTDESCSQKADTIPTNPSPKDVTSIQPKSESKTDTSNNLEDWLDSLLDD